MDLFLMVNLFRRTGMCFTTACFNHALIIADISNLIGKISGFLMDVWGNIHRLDIMNIHITDVRKDCKR